MLQGIRDRAQGWIAWIIVIFISVPFALWGINEYFGADPDVPVAEVNGTEISLMEFQRAYQSQSANLRSLIRAGLLTEATLRRQTLQALIGEEVLAQASEQSGMRISDAQLASAIHAESAFATDGQFSQARYELWLNAQQTSSSRFEYTLRRNLLNEQANSAYRDAEIITDKEILAYQALIDQERTFRILTIPRTQGGETSPFSEEVIKAEYENNKASYRNEEGVRLEYIELSRKVLIKDIYVEPSELMALYKAQKGNYILPEQRRASHLLITEQDNPEGDALARIKALKAEIDAGADFTELVKVYSEDPGSAINGGDLGFFGKGVMDPSFEQGAFELELNQISEPIRSGFGWHLIKVTDIRETSAKPFEEVREELLVDYQREKAEEQYFELAEQLANLAFENPDSLSPASDTLGLAIQISDFLTREPIDLDENSVFTHPKALKAAFSDPVLRRRENSDLIDLDDGRVVVLRVLSHEKSRLLTLEEVREDVVETLRFRAEAAVAQEKGVEILAQLRSAGASSVTDTAKGFGFTWDGPFTSKRGDDGIEPQILETVFRMPKPMGKRIYDALESDDGGLKLIELLKAAPRVPEEDKSHKATHQLLSNTFSQAGFRAFREGMRQRADVTIFTERLADGES